LTSFIYAALIMELSKTTPIYRIFVYYKGTTK
jgi:hypothetical protein